MQGVWSPREDGRVIKSIEMPPDTDDKILIELWVKKEELLAKIRSCQTRVARARPDVEIISNLMARHEDMIENLHSPHTAIVSMREYVKIRSDIKKMRKVLSDTVDYIKLEEEAVRLYKKEILAVEDLMERRKNPKNLIQFRPRGIIKS
jgi:hypothetical protein